MIIGLGIGIPFRKNRVQQAIAEWSPSSLFANNEQGAWYDPSDIKLNWRRNLLTYTEQFDNAAWTKVNVSAANTTATTDPLGGLASDKLVESATASTKYAGQGATLLLGVNYVTSVYIKAAERSFACLRIFGGAANLSVAINLVTGQLSSVVDQFGNYAGVSATATDVGNGWWRLALTARRAAGGSDAGAVQVGIANSLTPFPSYTGDGTSGIYIWGAQLELGSTATPYQRITDGIQDYLQYQAQPVLYRDAAGTQPVTAVEQPVGLMLDKSKGLVLGPELMTNGTFDSTSSWTLNGAGTSISGGTLNFSSSTGYAKQANSIWNGLYVEITVVVSSISAGALYMGWDGGVLTAPNITTPGTYTYRRRNSSDNFYILCSGSTTASVDSVSMKAVTGNHAFNSSGNSANFPVLSARYNQYLSTETLATQNVTTVAASYKLAFTGTGSITLSGTATGTYSAGTHTITCTAGTLTSTVSGTVTQADLRVANDALNQPAYQRVNTSTDYDTVGFKTYLRFNGVSQWLQTNSIDFTYGNKMFVSAGVRKLSDAADGIIVESGISAVATAGTFVLAAPGTLGSAVSYGAVFNGIGGNNRSGIGANTYSAPITNVATVSFNYAGASIFDEVQPRINGVLDQDVTFGVALANRNFTAQPLYIGARAGSSQWFNGRLYSLVVAGKLANAVEITETEKYVNGKTAAY